MLIQWFDLRPGDILELNPEFLKEKSHLGWIKEVVAAAPQFFPIETIWLGSPDEDSKETMDLKFNWYRSYFSIRKDNGAIWSDRESPSVFRVVALSED